VGPLPSEPAPVLLITGRAAFYILFTSLLARPSFCCTPNTQERSQNWPHGGHMADAARLSNSTKGVGPPYKEEVTLTALLVALVSADWTTWPSFKISTFKVP
jgi:hypothetical protein